MGRALRLGVLFLTALGLGPGLWAQAPAADYIDPGYLAVKDLLDEDRKTRRAAVDSLIASGDKGLAFGIVDSLFFIPSALRRDAFDALVGLTGEDVGKSYWNWVEWAGKAGDTIRPTAGYEHWKVILLSKIDPGYADILYPGAPMHIRLEEVVPGGVRIEGIPSLDHPPMVQPADARYLKDDEDVFGIELNGDVRAYPLRFLDWHEMLNDDIGGRSVSLSYCTLCGSGVLYDTGKAGEGRRFATSGLLYRSNKLMFDRETRTLWSNLYGVPVIGRLATEPDAHELTILPMTRTTWKAWRTRHPETTVVDLTKDLKKEGRKFGFDYRPEKANQARRGVSFPVWKKNEALAPETEIYTLRLGTSVRAYPLDELLATGLVHDHVGDAPVVLVADADSGAVRAYRRGADQRFTLAPGGHLESADGQVWTLHEDGLAMDGSEQRHERLAGHFAFWFGWYAFFPQTEIWDPA